MSNSSEEPWSDDPYAPKISYQMYFSEKANFAGILIGAIFYGIVIVLFFRCMGALLNPVNRTREGVKWGLVAHTTAMFLFVTVYTAMNLDAQSVSYIDNREFPGVDGMLPPGPLGYRFLIYSEPISIVPDVTFLLNNWLVDGLLLYRCYVIYSMNHWVIAFPCLMYLTSLVMGIMLVCQTSRPKGIWNSLALNTGIPYFSISVSLNVLLTLMIVTRLVSHSRNVRNVMGGTARGGGLYKAIIVMFVESSAVYAVNSLLFIGPWSVRSPIAGTFLPILAETQVIAPFLIILRVAKKSASTSNTIVPGNIGPMNFRSRGKSTSGGGTFPDRYLMTSMDAHGRTPGELGVRIETTVDFHGPDKV